MKKREYITSVKKNKKGSVERKLHHLEKKEAGALQPGRFRTRVKQSGKIYSRKKRDNRFDDGAFFLFDIFGKEKNPQ